MELGIGRLAKWRRIGTGAVGDVVVGGGPVNGGREGESGSGRHAWMAAVSGIEWLGNLVSTRTI